MFSSSVLLKKYIGNLLVKVYMGHSPGRRAQDVLPRSIQCWTTILGAYQVLFHPWQNERLVFAGSMLGYRLLCWPSIETSLSKYIMFVGIPPKNLTPFPAKFMQISTHYKLCLATATHKFKWVKNTHIRNRMNIIDHWTLLSHARRLKGSCFHTWSSIIIINIREDGTQVNVADLIKCVNRLNAKHDD